MTEFNLPHGDLLIAPEETSWAESVLTKMASAAFQDSFNQKVNVAMAASAADEDADDDDFWNPHMSWARPYEVANGVLTIPVQGMLTNKFPYAFGSWLTGYEYISKAIERGVADTAVTEIHLAVNSPGGYVAGVFDCADVIFEARGTKPIRAFADEAAYSAAYCLASSADSINVARTGGVGSIGILGQHADYSEALSKQGVKITLVYAGKDKVAGHPTAPLSKKAKARMQTRVDAHYDIFVATVARNRDLEEQTVRNTEAGTFMAQEAVENGLADAIGPIDTTLVNADPTNQEDDEMSNKDLSAEDKAAHETAVTEATATGHASGVTEGKAQGAKDERARQASIMDSEEAKVRPIAARSVATTTDMDADAAKAFLATLPEEGKAVADDTGTAGFVDGMNTSENPNLGTDGGNDPEEMSVAEGIFASAGFAPA